MKNFIKGFRFTPSNYPAEVEAKIQKYRKQGYKLPLRKVLRTPEQLEGIRESAKINTALLDYISENIREGMSTEEIDVMVYDFTTKHGAIPAPLNYEGFPKSVCTSINDVVCHGIPSKTEILQSGDIINVDVSTIYKGYFSDASRMFMIGDVNPEMRKLVQVTKECMEIGTAMETTRRRRRCYSGTCRKEWIQRSTRSLRAWRRYAISRSTGCGTLRTSWNGNDDCSGYDLYH